MNFLTRSQALGRVPVTIFHLHDRINLGNTKELERAAQDAFAQGARHLLLDLAEAPSITSAGLSSLTLIYKLFGRAEAGADEAVALESPRPVANLKLCHVAPEVRKVLGFVGLDDYIGMYDSLAEAVAAF
ncbi:MAG: STAS domain-containing protein [Chloroflexota bacterium]